MSAEATPLVVLGVTGSIAAYKAVEVTRRLGKAGVRVQVVMTESATRFVTPLTFEAISGRPVIDDPWARRSGEIAHVERAEEAAALLVAPASAHTLARLALGLADDPLSALALSTRAPLIVAPAMEHGMWHHPATRDHLRTLRARGALVVGPERGGLASGRSGDGRMAEPEAVVASVLGLLRGEGPLRGLRVLVTAGPTWEPIDPVRVLANRSTGAMGIAVAEEAAARGAWVRLVLGPTALEPAPSPRLETVRVETARQMLQASLLEVEAMDVLVGAAAVGDFRPRAPSSKKLKRDRPEARVLELEENPDVIAQLAQAAPRAVKVGFAAETEDVVEHARAKRTRKGLDWVVGNVVGETQGFGPGATQVVLVGPADPVAWSEPGDKRTVARFIWDHVQPPPEEEYP